jgi:heme A synthase
VTILIIILGLFAVTYAIAYPLVDRTIQRLIGPRFVIWYVLIILAGFVAPNAAVFILFSIVVTMATVRDRVDAICRYAFAATLLPNVGWRIIAGPVMIGDFTVTDFLGVTLIAMGFLLPRPRARRLRGVTLEDGLVAVLVAVFWIGQTRFPSTTIFLRAGTEMITLLLVPYLLVRLHARSTEEIRRLLACFMVAAAFLAAFALYERLFGWSLFSTIERRLWAGDFQSRSLNQRGGAMRASATMRGPLVLAFFMVLAAIATFGSRPFVRRHWAWVCWILAVLAGLAVTQSRGNIASLGIAMVVFLFVRRKTALAWAAGAAAAVGGLLIVLGARVSTTLAGFIDPGGEQRFGGLYDYRQLLLQRGLEEGFKRPLLGDELSRVLARLADIQQGEQIVDLVNSYLTIFLVSGLIGLLPFLALVLLILRKLVVGWRRVSDPVLQRVRAMVLAMFVVVLLELSFMSFIDRVPLFLMLIVGGSRVLGIDRRVWQRLQARRRDEAVRGDASATPQPAG